MPSLWPLSAAAAAATSRVMLGAAPLSLMRWTLSKMLGCFEVGLQQAVTLLDRGAVGT